jgi:hypothetical protein
LARSWCLQLSGLGISCGLCQCRPSGKQSPTRYFASRGSLQVSASTPRFWQNGRPSLSPCVTGDLAHSSDARSDDRPLSVEENFLARRQCRSCDGVARFSQGRSYQEQHTRAVSSDDEANPLSSRRGCETALVSDGYSRRKLHVNLKVRGSSKHPAKLGRDQHTRGMGHGVRVSRQLACRCSLVASTHPQNVAS